MTRPQGQLKKSIALVGFMGSGKTSVSQRVAEQLDLLYVDADGVVEAQAGKPIARIFSEDGEAAFRLLERTVLIDLAAGHDLCIATGGGSFVDDDVRASLLRSCYVVYLDAPFEVLWERIAGDPSRPLLQGDGAKQRMSALFDERRPFYMQSHVRVDAARPIESIAEDIRQRYIAHLDTAHPTEG